MTVLTLPERRPLTGTAIARRTSERGDRGGLRHDGSVKAEREGRTQHSAARAARHG